MTGPDPMQEGPDVGPEYGGSADPGVVSSVAEHAPAAGDVVDALRAEHGKLQAVFEEMLALVRAGDEQGLRIRWGGVVRELLEHEVAEQRVVLPAAEQVEGVDAVEQIRRRQQQVVDRLRDHDTLTPDDVSPHAIEEAIGLASAHLRAVDDVVVPLLERLPADERMRLGEDLRQVMG